MSEHLKLSIIVPIFGVEKYLKKCLISIINQTYSNFECMMVDDGSLDSEATICDEILLNDDRSIVVHKRNGGVSSARNSGLRLASGRLLGFVDPDDWVEQDMYQKMIHSMIDNEADIVCCNWTDHYESGEEKKKSFIKKNEVVDQEEFCLRLLNRPRTIMGGNCNKLFKKNNINFEYDETISICEDNLFLSMYCSKIKIATILNDHLYHILIRQDSATRKYEGQMAKSIIGRKRIIDVMSNMNNRLKKAAEADFIDTACYFYNDSKINSSKDLSYRDVVNSYCAQNWKSILTNRDIPLRIRIKFVFFRK